MTLDLKAAIEAAAEADWKFQIGDLLDGETLETWTNQPAYVRRSHRSVVQHLVEAAAPIIERQVRHAVAEAIFNDEQKCQEASREADGSTVGSLLKISNSGRLLGLQRARDIAEGVQDE